MTKQPCKTAVRIFCLSLIIGFVVNAVVTVLAGIIGRRNIVRLRGIFREPLFFDAPFPCRALGISPLPLDKLLLSLAAIPCATVRCFRGTAPPSELRGAAARLPAYGFRILLICPESP